MADEKKDWAIASANDAAEALDWVRRRLKGNGLVLVAISPTAVMCSKETRVSPHEAVTLIEESLRVIRATLERAEARRETRGCGAREDRDQ
jgi:hypothetical protein